MTDDGRAPVARAAAALALRDFAAHTEQEFAGEDHGTDYARGALDAARVARVRADRLDPPS